MNRLFSFLALVLLLVGVVLVAQGVDEDVAWKLLAGGACLGAYNATVWQR